MMGHYKGLHTVSFILVMIGALNWAALALFHWEIGSLFGGMSSTVSKVIYVLVGLAAVYEIATHAHRCKECKPDMAGMPK